MTGYNVLGRLQGYRRTGPVTWAATLTLAEAAAATMKKCWRGLDSVIIVPDRDDSDLGEVYHETPAMEALMEDFETRAALFNEEVESAWSTLRRHELARLDLGDAATFAVAEVLRKMEEEIAWLKHQNGLD